MYEVVIFTSHFWQSIKVFFIFIGLINIIKYFYVNLKSPCCILCAILEEYFYPEKKQTLKDKFGEWAVVTGSTDGIGKAYALELARNGMNIALISRSVEKLNNVAKEIETQFQVKTKCIAADFSEGSEVYVNIKKELEDISVGILVNNVGQMYDYPQELATVPEQKLWNMVLLNVGATVMMSRLLINKMKISRKGAIVNIGSITELVPGPYSAVYSASKIFVNYFTLALQRELADYNITVQLLKPGFIATKLTNFSELLTVKNILVADVNKFAKSAVYTLGKSSETSGCIIHGLQFAASHLVPDSVIALFGEYTAKYWNHEYKKKHKIL